jgi:polynucleotide 5'-kinase involved in rRNA processing
VGVKKLTERALASGSGLVIVDTSGLVRGASALKLKTRKIELLSARHVVALQKNGELEHILRLFDTWVDCTVHRLPVASAAREKPKSLRTQRRMVRFHEYFHAGQTHEMSLESVVTVGTALMSGTMTVLPISAPSRRLAGSKRERSSRCGSISQSSASSAWQSSSTSARRPIGVKSHPCKPWTIS